MEDIEKVLRDEKDSKHPPMYEFNGNRLCQRINESKRLVILNTYLFLRIMLF